MLPKLPKFDHFQFSPKMTHFVWKWPILTKLNTLRKYLPTVMLIKMIKINIFVWPQNLVILFQFIGVFRVRKAYFGGFPPISMNSWLFRAKYYIKPPKNHWWLNTVNCLNDISHLRVSDMAYFPNNGTMSRNGQRYGLI